jgi:hypothetical protein
VNIVLDHNCGIGIGFEYTEADGETVIDMTGGTLAAEIRPEPGGELLGEFTFAWVDQANGEFTMSIEAAAVNQIPDGVFRYDLIFTDAAGRPHKIRSGNIIKQGTITEP